MQMLVMPFWQEGQSSAQWEGGPQSTRSPTLNLVTPSPTWQTTPQFSWPSTRGILEKGGVMPVLCSSTSVPQMPT